MTSVQDDKPFDGDGDADADALHAGLGGHAQQREPPHDWHGPGHAQQREHLVRVGDQDSVWGIDQE